MFALPQAWLQQSRFDEQAEPTALQPHNGPLHVHSEVQLADRHSPTTARLLKPARHCEHCWPMQVVGSDALAQFWSTHCNSAAHAASLRQALSESQHVACMQVVQSALPNVASEHVWPIGAAGHCPPASAEPALPPAPAAPVPPALPPAPAAPAPESAPAAPPAPAPPGPASVFAPLESESSPAEHATSSAAMARNPADVRLTLRCYTTVFSSERPTARKSDPIHEVYAERQGRDSAAWVEGTDRREQAGGNAQPRAAGRLPAALADRSRPGFYASRMFRPHHQNEAISACGRIGTRSSARRRGSPARRASPPPIGT